MKFPFYKSLVAAGALASVGALVACGDDDSSSGNPAQPSVGSVCDGVVATEDVSVMDLGNGTKLVIYPVTIEGAGKVTFADGTPFGSFDGAAIYDAAGVKFVDTDIEMLSNKCQATATIDPGTGEVVLNSSASSAVPGEGPAAGSSATVPGTNPGTNPGSNPGTVTSSGSAVPGEGPVAGSSATIPGTNPAGTSSAASSDIKPGQQFPSIESYGAPDPSYTKDISGNGKTGWNTRYWDACKPHCSWIAKGEEGKTDTTTQETYEKGMTTARNCNIHDVEVPTFTLGHAVQQYWKGFEGTTSACEASAGAAGVFTCTDMAPIAVNENLSYAYVAGPGSSTTCGRCFHLQYDGSFIDVSSSNAPKATHKALKGKHLVVMTSNIGHDVKDGQFDLMVPGGGPGIFNALNIQVNGQGIEWGEQYGGFLSYCQKKPDIGYDGTLEQYQTCVKEMCDAAFGNAGLPNLLRGCHWFADWFMAADNPTYNWEEVECPQYLLDHYLTTLNKEKSNNYAWHTDWSTYKAGDPLETLDCTNDGCTCTAEMAAKGACRQ